MDDVDCDSQRMGATLSEETARNELGLTQGEIVQAIRWRQLDVHHLDLGAAWLLVQPGLLDV